MLSMMTPMPERSGKTIEDKIGQGYATCKNEKSRKNFRGLI